LVLTDTSTNKVALRCPALEPRWAMGSFVEVDLAFTFLPETPSVVLGAFAPFRTSTAPGLPTLEETLGKDEYERLDLQLQDYFTEEELEAMPLTHRAVMWRALVSWGANAYIPGPTFTTMHWDSQDTVWSLATRTMPKSSVEEIQAILSPLGVFASDGSPRWRSEVGSIADEGGIGTSIWSVGGAPFQFA
jgi:hypothetical protein